MLLSIICAPSFAAVMAYSVADDNFEMPDHLVQINLETGEYQSMGQIADPYIALEGLAISTNGTLYGADDNTKTLVQINPSEASAYAVANANQNLGFGAIPESYDFGMTFNCDNKLNMVVKHSGDLFEVNEAFASVPLAWLKATQVDPEKLNVFGGAIALGHPLGSSGTKLATTLIHALKTKNAKLGLQTMCEGGGMANVTIFENC